MPLIVGVLPIMILRFQKVSLRLMLKRSGRPRRPRRPPDSHRPHQTPPAARSSGESHRANSHRPALSSRHWKTSSLESSARCLSLSGRLQGRTKPAYPAASAQSRSCCSPPHLRPAAAPPEWVRGLGGYSSRSHDPESLYIPPAPISSP